MRSGQAMRRHGGFTSRLGIMGDLLLFFWRNKMVVDYAHAAHSLGSA